MTVYATRDADDDRIKKNATIRAFASEQEALDYLLKGYDAADWKLESAALGTGTFGDYWMVVHSEPHVDDDKLIAGACDCSPFAADQLYVLGPGEHPGGRAWWIEPAEAVLTLHIEPATD